MIGTEVKGMRKMTKKYALQWWYQLLACGTLSGIDPRPFLEISAKIKM
jgi:hypothetical protein